MAAPSSPVARMLAALCLVLAACGTTPEPDLVRTHARGAQREKPPLIVVPGFAGSRIVNTTTGEELWPGSLVDLFLGTVDAFARLARLPGTEDALDARGVILSAADEDYYSRLVETLVSAGGYTCVGEEEMTAEADCILMDWDWRRDLVHGAGELARVIDRVRELRGDPDLKVDLLGHSAGGLIVRYFVRFGGRDVLDGPMPRRLDHGHDVVRRALLLGVPNFGSIHGLQQMLTGHEIANADVEPEVLALIPSLYQLLPHPDRNWMIDIDGETLERDLYDPAIWRRYGWSIYARDARARIEAGALAATRSFAEAEAAFRRYLARGEAFHRALSVPVERSPLKYIVFGGDCIMTPAVCLLEMIDGEPRVRLHPDGIADPKPGIDYRQLMLEPGDGKVTRSSLLARNRLEPDVAADYPIDQVVFVCEPHAELPSNIVFQDNLLNQLLYP